LTGHGRCGAARARRKNVPMKRTSRKIHGKDAIQMVRQAIRPGILEKDGKELEAMEGQEASKKRDDEDNPGRRRRKIRSLRIVKDGIWRTEVKENRQKLLSVPEKCTTSERNVLSDDRKKTLVRS